jgi:hypothetical protein
MEEGKGSILEVTEQVLKEQGGKFVVERDGMIGYRLIAWIAMTRRIAL